jgi:hypothetical protein
MNKRTKLITPPLLLIGIVVIFSLSAVGNDGGRESSNEDYNCGDSCHKTESDSTISMTASNLTLSPGETVNVTVSVTGSEADDSDLGVFLTRSKEESNSKPSVDGWAIISDPSGTTSYNYYEESSVTGGVVWKWTLQAPTAEGTYTLYAREHHGNGARYFKDVPEGLSFTVASGGGQQNQLPTCDISDPSSGAKVGGTIMIAGTASDPDGTVERVEIRIDDDEWLVLDGTNPWSYEWNTTGLSDGTHTIFARSFDGTSYSLESRVKVTVGESSQIELEDIYLYLVILGILIVVILALLAYRMRLRRRG